MLWAGALLQSHSLGPRVASPDTDPPCPPQKGEARRARRWAGRGVPGARALARHQQCWVMVTRRSTPRKHRTLQTGQPVLVTSLPPSLRRALSRPVYCSVPRSCRRSAGEVPWPGPEGGVPCSGTWGAAPERRVV